ncbi:MAG: hypothetical protein J6330_01330 [Clostridia bacterium]|nr:hypothetical protein [Clostridia bacterium]
MTEIKADGMRFQTALEARVDGGDIGTYKEKTLHKTLKYYFCPDESMHEKQLCGKICDAFDGETVYEIQTGNFSHLKDKLAVFLPHYKVNVIYPLIVKRYVVWIDPETGESVSRRLSGKRGTYSDFLPQLYAVREYLDDPSLTLTVAYVECDDVRLLNGYGADRKIRAAKYDKVPAALVGISEFSGISDMKQMCPEIPDGEYRAKQIYNILKMREGANAWRTLKLLEYMGVIKETGRDGKAVLYSPVK